MRFGTIAKDAKMIHLVFAFKKQTAAAKDLEALLESCAEVFRPYPYAACNTESVEIRLKDPHKVIWVQPRRLSHRDKEIVNEEVEQLLRMRAIKRIEFVSIFES